VIEEVGLADKINLRKLENMIWLMLENGGCLSLSRREGNLESSPGLFSVWKAGIGLAFNNSWYLF
jgi:hypothetical protein